MQQENPTSLPEQYQTAREEYHSLRSEILARLQVQQRLTEFALILFAIFLLAVAYVVLTDRINSQNVTAISTILFITPLPFALLLWAHQEQNVFISFLGSYINQRIKPMLNIGWEDFLSQRRGMIHNIVTSSRFIFLLIAAGTPIFAGLSILSRFDQALTPFGQMLCLIDTLIILGAIWSRVKTVHSFRNI